MEKPVIEELSRLIVSGLSQYFDELGLISVFIFLVLTFLAGFFGTYIKTRSEHIANKKAFADLNEQLRATTIITAEIQSTISHDDWQLRELKTLLRLKLELMMEHTQAASTLCVEYFFNCLNLNSNEKINIADQFSKISSTTALYFPSLNQEATFFNQHCNAFIIWSAQNRSYLLSIQDNVAKEKVIDELTAEVKLKLAPITLSSINLQTQITKVMRLLLGLSFD